MRRRANGWIETLERRWLRAADVVINEFLASNRNGIVDQDGDTSDWIELRNRGDEAADLRHYFLSDDPENLTKWQLPSRQLEADEQIIVFASGKNRVADELHAAFKLDVDGEYLALTRKDGVVVQAFAPEYPPQMSDLSYGILAATESAWRFFDESTPGQPNSANGKIGRLQDTKFSVDRGFYQGIEAITVEITTELDSASIVYTVDGSAPQVDEVDGRLNLVRGEWYRRPLSISKTTVLRAAAYHPDYMATNVDSQTYVFPEEVIRQNGPELSETWGTFPYSSSIGGTTWKIGDPVPSDWDMDPSIVEDPRYRDEIISSLTSIPTVSLAVDPIDLFGEQGIYIHPLRKGREWERPVSVEYMDPNSKAEFQIDAGVRVHGGASRRPDQTRKHSLRLYFRGDYDPTGDLEFPFFAGTPYGDSAVETFDSLVLRGSYSDGFSVGDLAWAPINLRDQWARDTQLALGQPSPHGKFVHLYLNGHYWGLYNATERIDGNFVEAYLGGDADRADVVTDDGLNEGDTDAWNFALAVRRGDLSSRFSYQDMTQLVDLPNLIDYSILQVYAGNWDWPQNNWLAVRDRENGTFQFPAWDVEVGLGALRGGDGHDLYRDRSRVRDDRTPAQLYADLQANVEFRLLFADHLQRHFFHGGPLAPSSAAETFRARVDEVYAAMVPETARWGDHNGNGGPDANLPYQRDEEWAREIDWIMNTWFPQRTQIVLEQFKQIGLYPEVDPPKFLVAGHEQHGGAMDVDEPLAFAGVEESTQIWYTRDGTDPRSPLSTDRQDRRLIASDTPIRVLVPTIQNGGNTLGDRWQSLEFNDSSQAGWTHGPNGAGFERGGDGDYTGRIGVDVERDMDRIRTSVLIRIPFTANDLDRSTVASLNLRMQYDDGFVAYLNGQEVARDNVDPLTPNWNAAANGSNEARNYVLFDISEHLNLLRDGENILAIHGLNRSKSSNDLLFLPELIASGREIPPQPSATAFRYAGGSLGVTEERLQVQARALRDGEWSALSQAVFIKGLMAGDINRDHVVDIRDIDHLAALVRADDDRADMNADDELDQDDVFHFVTNVFNVPLGDANLDGVFDTEDIVQVFRRGEYEDEYVENSTWADGDWNGDGEVTSDDIVAAFIAGGFSA